jgi:hypothetical protein
VQAIAIELSSVAAPSVGAASSWGKVMAVAQQRRDQGENQLPKSLSESLNIFILNAKKAPRFIA